MKAFLFAAMLVLPLLGGACQLARSTGSRGPARLRLLAGDAAWQAGSVAEAEEHYSSALELAMPKTTLDGDTQRIAHDSVEDVETAVLALNQLGLLAENREELSDAEDLYRRALMLQHSTAPGGGEMIPSLNLSSVLFSQGRVLEAEEFATRALNMAEEDQDQTGAGHAHRVLGEINASTGRWQEGLSHLSRSVFLLERSGEHEAGAASHQVLGQVWFDVGQPRRAISEFSVARQEFHRHRDVEGEFRALRGLARCYAGINQVATALTYWERALELEMGEALELEMGEALREETFAEAWDAAQRLRPDRRPTWILRASGRD